MIKKDYCQISRQYMEDVISGCIPACKWVRIACQRQKNDLARKKVSTPQDTFEFNEKYGNRICRFIESLTHVKGALAGKNIQLEPWQVFILSTIFGWRSADNKRRFRRVYIEVPRGNGKSCLSSGVALYCLCADGEAGAEIYSFATTRDQAKIVFGDAHQMAKTNADLQEAFGVQVLANSLYVPDTNSTFQAKSAEGSTLDGLNTHLAVIDELHAHKTREVYDVVETSLGKRFNSLMWVITTAGFNKSGICYEVRSMVTKVLEGSVVDETQFGIIYTIDKDDDWTTIESLEKANPNWNISVRPEMLQSLQAKAMVLTASANNFQTKHLNVWVNADTAWMDMRALEKCFNKNLQEKEFAGQTGFIGLDLASKKDITAVARVYPKKVGDEIHYYGFCDYFLPTEAIENGTNSQYSGWVRDGYLKATEGAITDYGQIEELVKKICSEADIEEVAYDPFQATHISGRLSEEGIPMLEFGQTVKNFSEPMKTLEALVLSGCIHFPHDPVLNWMFSNVVCHVDAKENIYPRKERPENKIDGVVAMLMALARALTVQDFGTNLNAFLDL